MAKKNCQGDIQVAKLSKSLRKAFRLLQKVKDKAKKGVGNHSARGCPIACGFSVTASQPWRILAETDKKTLVKNGWDGRSYNAFINWYDFGWKLLGAEVELECNQARTRYLAKLLS